MSVDAAMGAAQGDRTAATARRMRGCRSPRRVTRRARTLLVARRDASVGGAAARGRRPTTAGGPQRKRLLRHKVLVPLKKIAKTKVECRCYRIPKFCCELAARVLLHEVEQPHHLTDAAGSAGELTYRCSQVECSGWLSTIDARFNANLNAHALQQARAFPQGSERRQPGDQKRGIDGLRQAVGDSAVDIIGWQSWLSGGCRAARLAASATADFGCKSPPSRRRRRRRRRPPRRRPPRARAAADAAAVTATVAAAARPAARAAAAVAAARAAAAVAAARAAAVAAGATRAAAWRPPSAPPSPPARRRRRRPSAAR